MKRLICRIAGHNRGLPLWEAGGAADKPGSIVRFDCTRCGKVIWRGRAGEAVSIGRSDWGLGGKR